MIISKNGIDLIKMFEGLSLKPVKLTGERYWTVGYGHYGADVNPNKILTQDEAEALLVKDLQSFVATVNDYFQRYGRFKPNQNQFDAMVSFCYNCGAGCLKQLISGRTADQVAEYMLAYTGSASETFRAGLARRRRLERELFLTPYEEEEDMIRYERLADIPADFRPTIKKLMDAQIIVGSRLDLENYTSVIDLSHDQVRSLVFEYRGGAFDRKLKAMHLTPAVEDI